MGVREASSGHDPRFGNICSRAFVMYLPFWDCAPSTATGCSLDILQVYVYLACRQDPNPVRDKIITGPHPRAGEASCCHECGTWACRLPRPRQALVRLSARRFCATNSFRILCGGCCSAQVRLADEGNAHNWASRVFCSEQNAVL